MINKSRRMTIDEAEIAIKELRDKMEMQQSEIYILQQYKDQFEEGFTEYREEINTLLHRIRMLESFMLSIKLFENILASAPVTKSRYDDQQSKINIS